jgi:hypothetical protein
MFRYSKIALCEPPGSFSARGAHPEERSDEGSQRSFGPIGPQDDQSVTTVKNTPTGQLCKGLTFLEVVFALFILTVALLGFSQIFNTAQQSSGRANHEIIASNLAGGLMAEIMSKNFTDPETPGSFGSEEGTNRYDFDDVDDYDDWSESPPKTAGKPAGGGYLDMDGTSGTPNYSNYSRTVIVKFGKIQGNDIVDVDDIEPTDYKKVTVTVSGPYGKDISIIELKTNL